LNFLASYIQIIAHDKSQHKDNCLALSINLGIFQKLLSLICTVNPCKPREVETQISEQTIKKELNAEVGDF
jgi:hypothetical protein